MSEPISRIDTGPTGSVSTATWKADAMIPQVERSMAKSMRIVIVFFICFMVFLLFYFFILGVPGPRIAAETGLEMKLFSYSAGWTLSARAVIAAWSKGPEMAKMVSPLPSLQTRPLSM